MATENRLPLGNAVTPDQNRCTVTKPSSVTRARCSTSESGYHFWGYTLHGSPNLHAHKSQVLRSDAHT